MQHMILFFYHCVVVWCRTTEVYVRHLVVEIPKCIFINSCFSYTGTEEDKKSWMYHERLHVDLDLRHSMNVIRFTQPKR